MPRPKLLYCLILLFSISFSACSPASITKTPPLENLLPIETIPGPEPTPSLSALEHSYVPIYYSPFYEDIINGSKRESGLLVYTETKDENLAYLIQIFREHYPWINVILLQLNPDEVFERYQRETVSKARAADIIISSDVIGLQTFIKQGQVVSYRSQEDEFLPLWAKNKVGIYTLSSEPMLIVYNKQQLSVAPETLQQVGNLANALSAQKLIKIVTYDALLSPNGFAANWFWSKAQGDAGWEILNNIGSVNPILMTSEMQMLDALESGKAEIGYFIPAHLIVDLPETSNLGWAYIKDGQPILNYNMVITQNNTSPNSAKLLVDFSLSQEGQLALSLGGLTPYRSDIAAISKYHLDKVISEVNMEHLIFFPLDETILNSAEYEIFSAKWQLALKRAE
jgi:iron(III) transport system substrate-binding protein